MYPQQAYSHYRKTQVTTASPERLVLLTYQALRRFLHGAIERLAQGDREGFHNHLLKAQDAIKELQVALDFEQGGEIAQNLWQIYSFVNSQLIRANVQKRVEPIEAVLPIIEELLAAWTEVCRGGPAGASLEQPVPAPAYPTAGR